VFACLVLSFFFAGDRVQPHVSRKSRFGRCFFYGVLQVGSPRMAVSVIWLCGFMLLHACDALVTGDMPANTKVRAEEPRCSCICAPTQPTCMVFADCLCWRLQHHQG